MSAIEDKLLEDIKTAMRAKDAVALAVLRSVKSALKYAAIEQGGADAVLNDADAMAIVRKQIKQRQDSVQSFREGGREELAQKEIAEIAILESYLPAPPTPEQITALVAEAIASTGATSRKDMGTVMQWLQNASQGAIDNKLLSAEVMKALS